MGSKKIYLATSLIRSCGWAKVTHAGTKGRLWPMTGHALYEHQIFFYQNKNKGVLSHGTRLPSFRLLLFFVFLFRLDSRFFSFYTYVLCVISSIPLCDVCTFISTYVWMQF